VIVFCEAHSKKTKRKEVNEDEILPIVRKIHG
jgi:hypothetical protein